MSTNLDEELRKALRPVDPDDGFAERVMSRMESAPAVQPRLLQPWRWLPQPRRWLSVPRRWLPRPWRLPPQWRRLPRPFQGWPAALAASVLLSAALIYAWQVDRERRGLEARRQLLEALHITGEKLDLAYRGVLRESSPPPRDDAGA